MSNRRRKPTIDDLYDRRYHNQPESGVLDQAEEAIVEAGRMAMRSLARTFELWLAVGKAVKTLRARADKIGGRKTFQRLLDQNGFQSLPAATITRLLRIVDRLGEVGPWHESLDEKQQREWSSPSAIFKHCPIFKTEKPNQKAATQKPSTKGTRATPTSSQDPWEARAVYTQWLKDAPRDARAVEVAQFMKEVGVGLPDLMKAREYLDYRDRQ